MDSDVYLKLLRNKAIVSINAYLSFCKDSGKMNQTELNELQINILDSQNKIELCEDISDLEYISEFFEYLTYKSGSAGYPFPIEFDSDT